MQHFGPMHRHIRDDLVRQVLRLDGVRSILDVGCGSGENLAALAVIGRYDLAGVDVSPEAIELARHHVPSAELSLLDVERETLDKRFDLVISIQCVEHLLDDIAGFRHIARMATKYVFISTIAGRMRPYEVRGGHVRNYSMVELSTKLQAVGLRVNKLYGWGFPFFSPIYRSLAGLLPSGPPAGRMSQISRSAAELLYQLYKLNLPGRGDVLTALATVTSPPAA